MKENDKNDSYVSWQDRRISQFGFVNNLLITLTTGLLAFETQLIFNKDTSFSCFEKWGWLLSVCFFLVSLFLGIYLAWNRLHDFRKTAQTARKREKNQRNGIEDLRDEINELGKTSWTLLKGQIVFGGIGQFILIILTLQRLFSK